MTSVCLFWRLDANFGGLSLLCDEFRFVALSERLSAFRQSAEFKEVATMEDSEARLRLSALEERLLQRDDEFAFRQCELARQSHIERQNARLKALEKKCGEHLQHFQTQEASLEAAVVRVSQIEAEQKRQSQAQESTAAALTADVGALQSWRQSAAAAQGGLEQTMEMVTTDVHNVRDGQNGVISAVGQLRADVGAHTHDVSGQGIVQFQRGWATGLDSAIVSGLPFLFSEFRGKRFSLLWRGGRDCFGAWDFHNLCDGHANTLTLIEDTNGNIFGGLTPVEWESREWNENEPINMFKADASLKSFLFTLKNPHNVPARRFALKAEKQDEAIFCWSDCGPNLIDICVSDNCNTNTDSFTELGESYTKDIELDRGTKFFTASWKFQVMEIEVFEITG
jgi:hypothetical protein